MTCEEFKNLIANGPLLLDGAMGTELERRGADTTGVGWSARAIVSYPDLIRDIHGEYITAGADIISSNTFRTNPRAQGHDGLNGQRLTKAAVRLATHARDVSNSSVLIAGSIAPIEDCFSPELAPSDDELQEEHSQMVGWLVEAGVDLILIETMSTLREALAAASAARAVSQLPILVSLVPRDAETLLDGTAIAVAVAKLASEGADLVSLNCGTVATTDAAMAAYSNAAMICGVPFGVYANLGHQHTDGSWIVSAVNDEEYATFSARALHADAIMIGSCCGSTPATTAVLRSLLDSWQHK